MLVGDNMTLESTLSIMDREVSCLELNTEYNIDQFVTNMCIKHNRNERGALKAMDQLMTLGMIQAIDRMTFVRIR